MDGVGIPDFLGTQKIQETDATMERRGETYGVFWNILEVMIAGKFGPMAAASSPLFRDYSDGHFVSLECPVRQKNSLYTKPLLVATGSWRQERVAFDEEDWKFRLGRDAGNSLGALLQSWPTLWATGYQVPVRCLHLWAKSPVPQNTEVCQQVKAGVHPEGLRIRFIWS